LTGLFFIKVGTTPAALTAYLAIKKLQPDLVINAGTAGGFSRKGGCIGDAYISLFCKHHDRRIPIPGFLEYGRGDHKSIPVPNLVNVNLILSFRSLSIYQFHPLFAL